jgi:4-diphosphocytidyl-2-C-methyl-D-erythritol kinase
VDQVTRLCPAKVNLYLKVMGRRNDGYHNLVTVMQPLSVADRLTVTRGQAGITVTCNLETLPTGQGNLVWRAAQVFGEELDARIAVRLDLIKRIPVAAGLGGGSSDAAGALLALNRLWDNPLDATALHRLAARLGADVPFFLTLGPQVGRDIGTDLTPVELPSFWYVLLNPGFRVSTRTVYQGLDLAALKGRTPILADDFGRVPPREWVGNDLETVTLALFPQLQDLLEAIAAAGSEAWGMSGSGPTLFGIFPSAETAMEAARGLRREYGGWLAVARGVGAGEPEAAWKEAVWII